jgi:hypothetical protein
LAAWPLFSSYAPHKLFSFAVTAQPSSKSPLSPIQISPLKKTWFRHGLLGLCVNANVAKKFRIVIPLGDFVDDLKTAIYTYVGINVPWQFEPLAAHGAHEE